MDALLTSAGSRAALRPGLNPGNSIFKGEARLRVPVTYKCRGAGSGRTGDLAAPAEGRHRAWINCLSKKTAGGSGWDLNWGTLAPGQRPVFQGRPGGQHDWRAWGLLGAPGPRGLRVD